jgi:hypothetical protein
MSVAWRAHCHLANRDHSGRFADIAGKDATLRFGFLTIDCSGSYDMQRRKFDARDRDLLIPDRTREFYAALILTPLAMGIRGT